MTFVLDSITDSNQKCYTKIENWLFLFFCPYTLLQNAAYLGNGSVSKLALSKVDAWVDQKENNS